MLNTCHADAFPCPSPYKLALKVSHSALLTVTNVAFVANGVADGDLLYEI